MCFDGLFNNLYGDTFIKTDHKVACFTDNVEGLALDMQDILKEIAAEARRINVRQVKEADVTPEQLKALQQENGLTLEKLGELLGVKHSTVSRWIRGKVRMTEHHQRAVRQLLSLTPEQLTHITEGEGGANES